MNLDHVDGSDETFNVLFDERYKGKISWIDTLNMMVVAAYALGIENPWEMTDEELAEVRDFLISKKGLVRFYWNQSFDFWRAFKTEVWAGYSWPDTVGYADAAGMNYLYMQPKEGRIPWVCGPGCSRSPRTTATPTSTWTRGPARRRRSSCSRTTTTGTRTRRRTSTWCPRACARHSASTIPPRVDEPNSHPETFIPRRSVYQQYWSEVQAA